MRDNIRAFVTFAASSLPLHGPIIEFGSYQVPGQEALSDLRPLFPGCSYLGTDMREGPGVDRVLDLHQIDLPTGSVGTALCLDTLEHVEYPHRATQEIHRILSPEHGSVLISSVMDFPIHGYPNDYWRFTPSGFASLLKPFDHSFVGFAGPELHPHTVIGVGIKGERPDLAPFESAYSLWQQDQQKRTAREIAQAIIPPFLFPALNRVYVSLAGLPDRTR